MCDYPPLVSPQKFFPSRRIYRPCVLLLATNQLPKRGNNDGISYIFLHGYRRNISSLGPPPAPATEILTWARYQERCLTSEQEATRQLPARTIEILLRPTNGHTHRGDVYSSQISLLRKAISGPPSSFLLLHSSLPPLPHFSYSSAFSSSSPSSLLPISPP